MSHDFEGIIDERKTIDRQWHWLMFALVDLVGAETVYDVGLKILEYPPTWVDTHSEAEIVESAVFEFLRKQHNVI